MVIRISHLKGDYGQNVWIPGSAEQVRAAACWIINLHMSLKWSATIVASQVKAASEVWFCNSTNVHSASHLNQWTVVRIKLAIMGWMNKFNSTSSLLEMYCGLQIGKGRTESVPLSQICDLNSPPMSSPNPKMGLWKSTLLCFKPPHRRVPAEMNLDPLVRLESFKIREIENVQQVMPTVHSRQ